MASSVAALRFNCGCGARPKDLEEAKEHSRKQGHTIHVLGEVFRIGPATESDEVV